MSRLTRRQWLARGGAAMGVALGTPSALFAHRAHVTLTELSASADSGRWEFVHSIHYHDALALLAKLGAKSDAQPGTAAGNARIALAIERDLRWFAPDGTTLKPATVGAELVGDNVVVYQEMLRPPARGDFTIESRLMHEVFADQTNNVSVEFTKPFTLLRLSRQRTRAAFTVA
jgi:hypothetical protein